MLITLLTILIQMANAWTPKEVNGEIVTWKSTAVDFYINLDGYSGQLTDNEVENAIVNASKAWDAQEYQSALEFAYQGTSKNQGADLSDGTHVVSFDQTWTHDPSLLAITHVWSNSNHEIVHFDIEINMEDAYWTVNGDVNGHDLQNSLTHEFGHALGLEHSDDQEATMSATTSMGETQKRNLNEDDIAGFVNLYPFSEGTESGTNTDNSNTNSANAGNSSSGAVTNNDLAKPSNTGSGTGPVQLEKAGCQNISLSHRPASLWFLSCPLLFVFLRRSSQ